MRAARTGWAIAWASVLAALLVAVGCAGAAANRDGRGARGGASAFGAGARGGAVGAPLAQRFDGIARQLARNGVRYDGIVAAGFITKGTTITTPFDLPRGGCLSIVALGSPGLRDLDAHLFSPDGDLVVEDTAEDPHPTVQLCASEPRRVYHVLEAFDGEGAFAVGTFGTDRRGLDAVARVMGGRPGTALSSAPGVSDAERRLAELRDGISHRGFLPSGDVMRAPFAAAGAVRFPVSVTPDRCYTLAALADGSLADTDLSVYDADGEEIARDVRPERDAFVQLCPAAAGTLSVEVRGRPGPGTVLLQPFAADAAAVGGANTLWLGERVAWGAQATPLPQSLDATRAALAAHGFAPAPPATPAVAAPSTMTFGAAESRERRVTVEAGRCTAVAAVAGRGLGRMQLALHDAAGELVARGVTRGPATIAVVCPSAREELSARLRAEVGTGDAALLTFAGPQPPAWAGGGLDHVAVSELLAAQLATAQAGWRSEGTPERLRLGARAVRTREIDVPAGSCARVAVATGRGLPVVALALRSTAGDVLVEGTGEGTAIVTRCSRAGERVRLDAWIDPPGPAEYDAVLARFSRADRAPGAAGER